MSVSFSCCSCTLGYGMLLDLVDKLKEDHGVCFFNHPIEHLYKPNITPDNLKELLPFMEETIPKWEVSDDQHDYDGYIKSWALDFIEGAKKAIKSNKCITVT